MAKELNVDTPEEAERRAFEIAAYVARIEKSEKQKLMLKNGGKYFDLYMERPKAAYKCPATLLLSRIHLPLTS